MEVRNIEFWKTMEKGNAIKFIVDEKDPNSWIFSKPVYFDEIAEPEKDMAKYFETGIKVQTDKEKIGEKQFGYFLDLKNIKKIISINDEPFNPKKKKEKASIKTKDEAIDVMVNNSTIEKTVHVKYGFDVMQIGDRWVCPCYKPSNPDKYAYSIKANAVFFHRKHIK